MRIPPSRCPITDSPCSKSLDCNSCSSFSIDKVSWVCTFCVRGKRDVRLTGAKPDFIYGGLYSSGQCSRCRSNRICLMAVKEVEVPIVIHKLGESAETD